MEDKDDTFEALVADILESMIAIYGSEIKSHKKHKLAQGLIVSSQARLTEIKTNKVANANK